MEESKKWDILLSYSGIKYYTEKNLAWWPIFFSYYFIPVYVSFITAKNCSFVMGFDILAIYFQLKNSFLLLYLM